MLVQGVSYLLLGLVDILFLWAAFTKFQHRVSTADKFQAIGLGEGLRCQHVHCSPVRTLRPLPLCIAWQLLLLLLLLVGWGHWLKVHVERQV